MLISSFQRLTAPSTMWISVFHKTTEKQLSQIQLQSWNDNPFHEQIIKIFEKELKTKMHFLGETSNIDQPPLEHL